MNNPVLTNLPKVGIRPTIDGRLGGVRESLEDQTMNMAKATAKLIASKLRYPTGESVKCVIADTCIGGVAEAAACAEKFRKENVGVSLTVTPCWCYGSETMDADPLTPKAVWGFNGTESAGAGRRSRSGSPRCSRPTAPSTARTSAWPARPIPISVGVGEPRNGRRGSPSTGSAMSKSRVCTGSRPPSF